MTQKQIECMKSALERIADMNGRTLPAPHDESYEVGAEAAFATASWVAQIALDEVGE